MKSQQFAMNLLVRNRLIVAFLFSLLHLQFQHQQWSSNSTSTITFDNKLNMKHKGDKKYKIFIHNLQIPRSFHNFQLWLHFHIFLTCLNLIWTNYMSNHSSKMDLYKKYSITLTLLVLVKILRPSQAQKFQDRDFT